MAFSLCLLSAAATRAWEILYIFVQSYLTLRGILVTPPALHCCGDSTETYDAVFMSKFFFFSFDRFENAIKEIQLPWLLFSLYILRTDTWVFTMQNDNHPATRPVLSLPPIPVCSCISIFLDKSRTVGSWWFVVGELLAIDHAVDLRLGFSVCACMLSLWEWGVVIVRWVYVFVAFVCIFCSRLPTLFMFPFTLDSCFQFPLLFVFPCSFFLSLISSLLILLCSFAYPWFCTSWFHSRCNQPWAAALTLYVQLRCLKVDYVQWRSTERYVVTRIMSVFNNKIRV